MTIIFQRYRQVTANKKTAAVAWAVFLLLSGVDYNQIRDQLRFQPVGLFDLA